MINVRSRGRLGNQMFYYAFARALQEANPDWGEIRFVPDNQNHGEYGALPILDFNVKIDEVAHKPQISIKQKILMTSFKILRRIVRQIKGSQGAKAFTIKSETFLNKNGLYAGWFSENVKIHHYPGNKDVWTNGLWENPVYSKAIKASLKKELTPKHEGLSHNVDLLNEIKNTQSVCVSIRRGDFLQKGNEIYNVCTKEYFYEAERILAKSLGTYKLFVFSDDIEWFFSFHQLQLPPQ